MRRGENWSTRRKTPRSREENQQQTQPTYCVESENRSRTTSVGDQCSHHCAIPAPKKRPLKKTSPAIRQRDSDSIMTGQAFAKSRDALKSKQKQLKRLDRGNKPQEASSLNQEEIDPLFNRRVMGIHSPQELINTLWFNNRPYNSDCEEEKNSSLGEMYLKQRQYW